MERERRRESWKLCLATYHCVVLREKCLGVGCFTLLCIALNSFCATWLLRNAGGGVDGLWDLARYLATWLEGTEGVCLGCVLYCVVVSREGGKA